MDKTFDHQILQQHVFGVADATTVDDLPEGIVSEPLVPPDLSANAHLMPRLIDFRSMAFERKDALLQCLYNAHKEGLPPPVSLLIKSGVDAKDFASHWNALQLATPEPGRRVWLRLHDTRVMHQLFRMLTPQQRRPLFGRSEAFTYWVGGEWMSVPASADPSSAAGAKWDWPRIELIGTINRALHAAGVHHAAALASQGALAEQLIKRAMQRHGLSRQDDLVEFAMRGLSTRATFDEHPEVAAAIMPGTDPDDDANLTDRLALIDEPIWAALRQPLENVMRLPL